MFEPTDQPRVFGTHPGTDIPNSLVAGLTERSDDLSDTIIYVNTTRMQRRIQAALQNGPARILPSVRLITDLGIEGARAGIPAPVSTLRRRLELFPLVRKLIDSRPGIASRAAVADWADSLAKLLEEMSGEGVPLDALLGLDTAEHSGHWQNALTFLNILEPFLKSGDDALDPQARLRLIVSDLTTRWQDTPPQHPVIIAGSTGSRGVAHDFMTLVSRLPQGAVVLPGFDFAMPNATWSAMDDQMVAEDHPQFRFRAFLDTVGVSPSDVAVWGDAPPDPARNAVVSLALRPAPVTDQWRIDGPQLGDVQAATAGLTLVETDTPRQEAEVIALRLRDAAAKNQTAALVTPDRNLTRQVTAALDRWDLTPDDSAGVPLSLTASGRILRHTASLLGQTMTAEDLLVLLKHPLVHSGRGRGPHLMHARRLELKLRREGPPYLTGQDIKTWALAKAEAFPAAVPWATWLSDMIDALSGVTAATLTNMLTQHLEITAQLCAGSENEGSGKLWDERAGREARKAVDRLMEDADALEDVSLLDYRSLFDTVLADGTVRDPDAGDKRILIWGTLEARVGGADLVILGGLNDGIWPEAAKPDPWLNRQMRKDAGLLLPERRIGLSAHDFQLAMAAPEVWITRSKRSADAETVPSRWLNRLVNLMDGLPDQGGPDALAAARARGDQWLNWATALEQPVAKVALEQRPSPRPPLSARPRQLSVTQIKTLIRDPYAIYARHVLQLRGLDPLQANADAPLKGDIFHKILERFAQSGMSPDADDALDGLMALAREELNAKCPWPTVQLQWLCLFEAVAPLFLNAEIERRITLHRIITEGYGRQTIPAYDFELTARADRIDLQTDGQAKIYDYKTASTLPSSEQQLRFDKQLLLTAAMVEHGAFEGVPATKVSDAAFLSVHPNMKVTQAPLEKSPTTKTWEEFTALIGNWRDPTRGYSARMKIEKTENAGEYDTLARFGEWDDSAPVNPLDLT